MPNSPVPRPERLTYDDIREEVAAFIQEFELNVEPPVDIEHIVDVSLGLDVVPIPRLRDDRDIEAFLTLDRQSIYIQEELGMGRRLHRHRFSLAHEVGHWYLHDDLYQAAQDLGFQEIVPFMNTIPEDDVVWYEWQAKAFAGLLLVPRNALDRTVQETLGEALKKGLQLDLTNEVYRDYVALHVGGAFQVSQEVVVIRGYKDGLWQYQLTTPG